MSTPQEVFRALAALPTFSGAAILSNSSKDILNVQVNYNQRDLERNVRRKYSRNVVLTVNSPKGAAGKPRTKLVTGSFPGTPVDLGDIVLQQYSISGAKLAILRSVSGEKKKSFVEIWAHGAIQHLLDVTDKHGDFYGDDTFGGLEWSNDETKLVYVAERKKSEDSVEKYAFKQDWGELFIGKQDPSLVLVNLDDFEVKVLGPFEGDMSPGQAIFGGDSKSIIFTGYHRDPQRYGIVFCQNRLTGIYVTNLSGENIKEVSSGLENARSPRLNKDGQTLVFLSNEINGPHASCTSLRKVVLNGEGQVETVVPVISASDASGFLGLYVDQLPRSLWVSDNEIVTSTQSGSRRTLVKINIDTKSVTDLTPASQYPGSVGLLFADINGWVITVYSTPTSPHILQLSRYETGKTTKLDLETIEEFSLPAEAKAFYEPHQWSILRELPGQRKNLEVILVEPCRENQKSSAVSGDLPPLVVFPHGGPHAAMAAEFGAFVLVLVQLGFTVAQVNYTGSLGFGQDCVEALVGKVGDLDVKECHAVRDHICSLGIVDKNRCVVTGGSHGGFIATHLVGQFPDAYKACVMRNPVTDLPALVATSDIQEWSYAVTGLDYDMRHPPTATLEKQEVFSVLRKASPMAFVDQVRAPSLMLLGSNDKRVPNGQGISWWQARQNYIKANGQEGGGVARIHMFNGTGHGIDSVEAESNSLYHLANFFLEFVRIEP